MLVLRSWATHGLTLQALFHRSITRLVNSSRPWRKLPFGLQQSYDLPLLRAPTTTSAEANKTIKRPWCYGYWGMQVFVTTHTVSSVANSPFMSPRLELVPSCHPMVIQAHTGLLYAPEWPSGSRMAPNFHGVSWDGVGNYCWSLISNFSRQQCYNQHNNHWQYSLPKLYHLLLTLMQYFVQLDIFLLAIVNN